MNAPLEPRVVIVADDLTGACDAGVAFAPARVVLQGEGLPERAVVYSTESRDDPPKKGAGKVAAVVAKVRGAPIVYKKIDSLIRGNVAGELAAALEASGRSSMLVCPAFPEQGRTVVDEVALPAGINLRELLEGLPVEVPDATTEDDLDRIADDALSRHPVPLLAGSAGLARALAQRLGYTPAPERPASGKGSAVLCIGSDHPVTLEQIEYLEGTRLNSFQLYRAGGSESRLELPPGLEGAIGRLRAGGLFLCGGETAAVVCKSLEAESILLEREILPGIPLGWICGGTGHGLAVVTKSGGFGAPDALVCVVDRLCAQDRRPEV